MQERKKFWVFIKFLGNDLFSLFNSYNTVYKTDQLKVDI